MATLTASRRVPPPPSTRLLGQDGVLSCADSVPQYLVLELPAPTGQRAPVCSAVRRQLPLRNSSLAVVGKVELFG